MRELTTLSGTVIARYDYDPYGRRTQVSGTLEADFGYTGHYHHALSDLTVAPLRFYDPDVRWLSRDPIGEEGGLNLYGYVFNNPTRLIDPLGLDVCVGEHPAFVIIHVIPSITPRLSFAQIIPTISKTTHFLMDQAEKWRLLEGRHSAER